MWEMRILPPIGRLSIRKFLSLAAAVIAVSFAWAIATSPAVHAADAEWKGESIVYDGHQYGAIGVAAEGDSHGLPKGSTIYSYIEPNGGGETTKAHLLYFEPGTDVATAETATLVTYDFSRPFTYSNPSGKKSISISNQLESGAEEGASACVYEGVGWIVCPITNFMADAVDWIFGILTNFLSVRPLSTEQDTPLYRAWSIMRDFANVAFVIAFMIVIYSQVTSTGISNYGIKRILPRLIIAAILVNISYWICAVAVDASNIAGVSLQKLFMGMREQITNGEGNSWDIVSWKSVTTAILSGGTIATTGVVALISVGSVVGALYYLLPVLLGVLIAAIVALVIMAARQAIITILIIISPLAFVAFLLPNTEKFFDKWKGLMTTMLMLFPIFSVLFGGSQVAGIAIIQNADTMIMVILGMAVQVAPLVLLPFLIKFGGGLIGRIAGSLNDKKKGVMDKTRAYAENQAGMRKSQVLSNPNLRRRNLLGRAAQGLDQRRRRREAWQKVNEAMADNKWMESEDFKRIDTANREADRLKKTLENRHEAEWNVKANVNADSLKKELELRVSSDQVELSKSKLDANHAEVRSFNPEKYRDEAGNLVGHAPKVLRENPSLEATTKFAYDTATQTALAGMRKEAADNVRRQNTTDILLTEDSHRKIAGGIRGAEGKEAAFAAAVETERKEYMKNVTAKAELMKHFNLDAGEYQKLALGKEAITRTDTRGHTYTFNVDDDFTREAAIAHKMKTGSYGEIERIVRESGIGIDENGEKVIGVTNEYATSISSYIKEFGVDKKAGFLGAQTINDIGQGLIHGEVSLDNAAIRHLEAGKIKAEDLAGMNASAIERFFKVARQSDAEILASPSMQSLMQPKDNKPGRTPAQVIESYRARSSALTEAAEKVLDDNLLSRNADSAALKALRQSVGRDTD